MYCYKKKEDNDLPTESNETFFAHCTVNHSLAFTSCEQEDWPVKTDQTVLMYLPWSSNLKSYFETNISDFESVVERNILKNERVVVFFCTSPTEAVLFELAYDNGKCIRKPLKNLS